MKIELYQDYIIMDTNITPEVLKTMQQLEMKVRIHKASRLHPDKSMFPEHIKYIPIALSTGVYSSIPTLSALNDPSILNDHWNIDKTVITDSEIYVIFAYPLCKISFVKLKSKNITLIKLLYKICMIAKNISKRNYNLRNDGTIPEIIMHNYEDIKSYFIWNLYEPAIPDLNNIYIEELIYDTTRKILYIGMGEHTYIGPGIDESITINLRENLNIENSDAETIAEIELTSLKLVDFINFPDYVNNFRLIDDVVISDPNIIIKFTYALRKNQHIKLNSENGHTLRTLICTVYETYRDASISGNLIISIKKLHLLLFKYDPAQKELTMEMYF